jgi:predicted RNase H-like nuclease (RuvC/YqgF family)
LEGKYKEEVNELKNMLKQKKDECKAARNDIESLKFELNNKMGEIEQMREDFQGHVEVEI